MAIELDESGFAQVTIRGEKAEETKRVDLFEAYCKIDEIRTALRGKPPSEWLAGVRDLLVGYGFPPCSLYVANEFTKAVNAAVDQLGNADGGESKPDSPASTGPEPSPSPDPTN